MLRWRDLPKPLVCKVRGYCIYGAVSLMSCADVIFAAEDAKIMPAVAEYTSWPFDTGARKAKELLFAGSRFVSGKEAADMGLVNRAVPEPSLDQAVEEYVAKVVKQPAFTLRMYKQAVNQKDDQAGFHNYTKAALAHWTLMADSMGGGGLPKKGERMSIIPKSEA